MLASPSLVIGLVLLVKLTTEQMVWIELAYNCHVLLLVIFLFTVASFCFLYQVLLEYSVKNTLLQ